MGLRTDLPVRVELEGLLGEEVTRWVEGEAGWQVVADGGPLLPVLTLCDRPRPDPTCVVVVRGAPTAQQVRDGLGSGALDVVGWPQERNRLLTLPLQVLHEGRREGRPGPAGPGPLRVTVAGTGGGSGTSTVALAIGGLLGWQGKRSVVVGTDDLLPLCGLATWRGPGAAELAALGAPSVEDFMGVSRSVPGVAGMRVLAGEGPSLGPVPFWPVDAVVVDHGTALPLPGSGAGASGMLIICTRPDGRLRRAAPLAEEAAVLVVGEGSADAAAIRRLLGRHPDGRLPASARVGRAGLVGRVPGSLPGSWLRGLRKAIGIGLRRTLGSGTTSVFGPDTSRSLVGGNDRNVA